MDRHKSKRAFFEIDFGKLLEGNVKKPYGFYPFRDMGWYRAIDHVASVDVRLGNAWTIKFFEHLDAHSPGHHYDFTGSQYISHVGNDLNDRISAFQLVPLDDLP